MLIFPIGEYSKTPYFIRSLGIRIYSMEELSYCIVENALRIDENLIRDDLVTFIGRELGLSELSAKLSTMLDSKDVAFFCRAILLYTGFVGKEKVDSITELLKENQSVSPGKRYLRRGDYYIKNSMAYKAISEYKKALKEFASTDETKEYAICLHNIGCACAKIFDYKNAARYFMQSYELSLDEETYTMFLASLRLGNSKEEYLSLIKEDELPEDKVKDLEDWIGVLLAESAQSLVYRKFTDAIDKMNAGEASLCYSELLNILGEWKKECRRNLEIENI